MNDYDRAKMPMPARSQKRTDGKTRRLISKLADSLVGVTVADDSKQKWAKMLNFSPVSLKAIDTLIKTVWAGERPSDQYFDTMVWAFGGYVAEIIQRNHEGVWRKSKNHYDFEFRRNGDSTGFRVSPWAWAYKRFDEGDLLSSKYTALIKIADRFYAGIARKDQA